MTFAVLGIGNENFDGKFKAYYENEALVDTMSRSYYKGEIKIYHNSEYKVIGKFAGYFLTVLRISLGDSAFEPS